MLMSRVEVPTVPAARLAEGGSNPLRIMRSAGEAHCLVRGRERLILSCGEPGVFTVAGTPWNGEPLGNTYRSIEYAHAFFGQCTIFDTVIPIGTEA